jgi:hypothetical protein
MKGWALENTIYCGCFLRFELVVQLASIYILGKLMIL